MAISHFNLNGKDLIMINYSQVIKALRMLADDPEYTMMLSIDEKSVIDKNTGKIVHSVDEYIDFLRKKNHCDFEVIYSDALNNVHYQCKECGTVIFASDDYEDYDDNLCCPTCGGYETHFKHWTKEEIEADPKKQEVLDFYQEMMRDSEAAYARKKKTGLAFNELWKKQFENELSLVELTLRCNHALKEGLKGLELEIVKFERDEIGFVARKWHTIPLSWSSFYIRCIYPYSKKCHPDFRKYLPWQKKPE